MTFKGKRIAGGDKLWTMGGELFTISDWSNGTGDIYGHRTFGRYVNIKKMPELSWNYPFISRRVQRG